MIALLILVGSLTLQALVQPYQSQLINVLDVWSLFHLVITQVVSIVYLYLDSKDDASLAADGLERKGLEMGMTIILFISNLSVIVVLFGVFFIRFAYEKLMQHRKKAKRHLKFENQAIEMAALANQTWWLSRGIARGDAVKHPSRGEGSVVAINPEGDGLVHVEFKELGSVHRYKQDTWDKFEHASEKAWWTRRWNGELRVGAEVRHSTHGVGAVVALSPNEDLCVHVKFEGSAVHSFAERDWAAVEPATRGIFAQEGGATMRGNPMNREPRQLGSQGPMQANPMLPVEHDDGARTATHVHVTEDNEGGGGTDEEGWYYEYASEESPEMHGPFSLDDLMAWRNSKDLVNEQLIHRGVGGAPVELLEALFDEGLDDDAWWYDDDSEVDLQHGPYTIEQLGEWLKEGQFGEHELIRRGREGEPVAAGVMIESHHQLVHF
jgi:hypothetical protein